MVTLILLIIGGTVVGWLFRKEYGESGIFGGFGVENKVIKKFIVHSVVLAVIISGLAATMNLLSEVDLSAIADGPFWILIILLPIAIGKNWIFVLVPMQIGNWLHRRYTAFGDPTNPGS